MAKKTIFIHSQLLTLEVGQLILPNTAVAEIIHYSDPTPVDDSPEWLLGTMEWRGIRIPLMSLEQAMGDNVPARNANNHIAIINCLDADSALHFYGIVTIGLPRLINIDEKKIMPSTNEANNPLVLSNVLINESESIIPNLDAIEALVKETGLENSRIS
ncbi:MAG: chemotaxis protein CheW [Gammaproteobacteria bacterium]|nr:chemotaxis protein CheW [Gammaproteobacteria bacterium]